MPTAEEKSPARGARKKRALWKRLLRGLFFAAGLFLLLLVLLTIVLRILYPPERLRAMLDEAAVKSLHRHLTLGDVWIHPLRGLILEDVRLDPWPDSTSGYDLFVVRKFHARKISLSYSLAGLLDRQLHLHEVEIVEPDMEFFVDMLDTSAIDLAALAATDLPVHIDLRTFRLQNSKISLILADTLTRQDLYIGDLAGAIDDLRLPAGGFLRNDSALQLQLHLQCPGAPLRFRNADLHSGEALQLDARLDMDTRLSLRSFHDIALTLDLQLENLEVRQSGRAGETRTVFRPPLRFKLDARGEGHAGIMQLDSLSLALDGRKWLQLEARIDSLYQDPRIAAGLTFCRIPLGEALQLAQEMVPAARQLPLRWLDEGAALTIPSARMEGTLAHGFSYEARLTLERAGLALRQDSIRVAGLAAEVRLHGTTTAAGPEATGVEARFAYDQLHLRMAGAAPLQTGAASLHAHAALNRLMLPEQAELTLQLHDLLGMEFAAAARLRGGAALQQLSGQGSLQLTDIDLARIPAAPVQGEAELRVDWRLETLDKITADLRLATTPLTLSREDEPLLLSDLNLGMHLRASTDTTFASLRLDTLALSLNRMVEASGRAEIDAGRLLKVRFALERLVFDHAAIWDYLPEAMREPLNEAELTGRTTLSAAGSAAMAGETLDYDVAARLATSNTSFRAPAQFLLLNGLGLNVELKAASRTGVHLAAELALDSLRYDQFDVIAFHHNRLTFRLESDDPAARVKAAGRLELPDLFITADLDADLRDLAGARQLAARLNLRQAIADSLRLPQGLTLSGASEMLLRVDADTALARIAADVTTRDLAVVMPGSMKISDIDTDLHVRQEVELGRKRLVGATGWKIATPSAALMDYMVYRDYYQGRQPNLSRLHIGRVEMMGYMVDAIDLELLAEAGRLEIPALTAKIYGGNLGGRAAIDLAEGDLRQATFEINCHLANINSDLILPKRRGESQQGIINANMDLRGRGLDPAAGINLEGQAYITEIGPRVADNLLRSLDPQGTDSSIRATRLLINQGFKPRLMTFVLRHGYLYPEIIFAQPWYFPMRLSGGKVELARIPLDFFLRNTAPAAAMR